MACPQRGHLPTPATPGAAAFGLRLLAGVVAGVVAMVMGVGQARARCIDEESFELTRLAAGAPLSTADGKPDARHAVQQMVRDALLRSNSLGAARLLTQAAEQDVEEARAALRPQAALTGAVSPAQLRGTDGDATQLQTRAGLAFSQTIFDGGRGARFVDWRRQQAEATRLGLLSVQEQVTLAALSLALERSRYRQQVVAMNQYVRKMACLVEALQTIVNADKGRTSELVQARKQYQQAELQQSQAVSQSRLVEAKLRRIVGDGLPSPEGMPALLLKVPELPEVLTAAEQSHDIAILDANAAALRQLARAMEAGGKPQVSWNVNASTALGAGTTNTHASSVSAGVTVSIPLLNPATDHTVQAARKRSEAAALQRAEALEGRRQRIVEAHEQAAAAFDRVRRVGLVLRESERLRNFTLQQWQQLGRRSLFDVMAAESDHYNLRVQYINSLHDGQQTNAMLTSLGQGLWNWLQ
jgi:outer membrane protein, adhesin transport system